MEHSAGFIGRKEEKQANKSVQKINYDSRILYEEGHT
jgi:hypothetical protein